MIIRNLILVILSIQNLVLSHQDLPWPYNTLTELLPFDPGGWYPNGKFMEPLLKELDAKIVIELGCWKGASTRHIASCLPENGIVYAVDHWYCPPYDHPNLIGCKGENIFILYQQFLSNTIHANLTHKIIPMRMTTADAAQIFFEKNISPDVVYVDASHDEVSVYQDITNYFPLVRGHGVICGDDWGWGIGWGYTKDHLPVQQAVMRFARENNLEIELKSPRFWILREKKEESRSP